MISPAIPRMLTIIGVGPLLQAIRARRVRMRLAIAPPPRLRKLDHPPLFRRLGRLEPFGRGGGMWARVDGALTRYVRF